MLIGIHVAKNKEKKMIPERIELTLFLLYLTTNILTATLEI